MMFSGIFRKICCINLTDYRICKFYVDFNSWPACGSELERAAPNHRFYSLGNAKHDNVTIIVLILKNYILCRLFPEVVYTIVLKRHPKFYVLSFIIPCGVLSVLNLLVFLLPTESGEKVSLGITNLLALVLFQQLIADSLPPSSRYMPILSKY